MTGSSRWVSYHSSASLLQSLICIWYIEICLCLHPSSKSSHGVNKSLAIIYLMDFCHLSLTLHRKDRLYWIWQLVLPVACIWYSNILRHHFKASLVYLPHHPSAHSLPWSQAFFPSHQRPALHHINPQSPLTNTLHGHDLDFTLVMSFDLDFMSVLTFNLDFVLVWLWLSSNSPTLFLWIISPQNYLFLLRWVCIPFFPSSENEII